MKKGFLLLALLIACNIPFCLQAQWTSLGSGITATQKAISGISPVNENVIWAVTANTNSFTPSHNYTRTTDGGQTWHAGTMSGVAPSHYVFGLFALDGMTAWVATADEQDPISGRVYKTNNGGSTWVEQSTGFTGFNETPAGVNFWNANEGVAFGATALSTYNDQVAVYTTSNGGDNWTKVVSPNMPTQLPGEGMAIFNYGGYYAVVGDTLWFTSTKNRIFKTTDRGLTWQAHQTSFNNPDGVSSVAFADGQNGLATTFNPFAIARTADGGVTWNTLPGTYPSSYQGWEIEHVPGTRSTYYLMVSATNYLLTYDGGEHWETHTTNIDSWSIKFLNPSVGFSGSIVINATTGGMYKWTGPALGNRLFVNDDAAGANDGTSWANAFNDLQDALAIAEEGDQIWVAEGTYKPDTLGGSQNSTFLIDKNLQLYGGFAGTETTLAQRGDPAAHPTLLSGDLNGDDIPGNFGSSRTDNVLTVLLFSPLVTNATLLDGLTIANGQADGTGANQETRGGGLFCEGSLVVRHCLFAENYASASGGGAYFRSNVTSDGMSVEVSDCKFENNASNANGGGLFFFCNGQNAAFSARNCHFSKNTALWNGGGLGLAFGNTGENGTFSVDSCTFQANTTLDIGGSGFMTGFGGKDIHLALTNSVFRGNSAGSYGTVAIWGDGSTIGGGDVVVDNCLFEDNIAESGSSGIDMGSFIPNVPTNFSVSNCTFKNNTTARWSGGMTLFGDFDAETNFQIEDCIFEGNKAGQRGGGLWVLTSSNKFSANFNRCRFIENESPQGAAAAAFEAELFSFAIPKGAQLTFDNCLFSGNIGSNGVISLDSLPGTRLLNCTIADNDGGGIQLSDQSTLSLQNTVLANPGHPEFSVGAGDVSVTSNGGNLVLDNSLNGPLTPLDKPETEPGFEPGTYEPSAGSPLVNGGVNDGVTAATDLAGNARIIGGTVDIGAYESLFTRTKEVVVGSLTLSPNPATDFLQVTLPATINGSLQAYLFDAGGQMVRTFTLQGSQTLEVGGLAPGVYTLKASQGQQAYAGTFIKH